VKTLVKGKEPGESRVWVSSQALGHQGRKWRHGRAWLFFGPSERRRVLGVSWAHGGLPKHFGVSLTVRHFDDLIGFSFYVPVLFSWHVWYENGRCYFDQEREISLRIFSGRLWWHLWMPIDEWRSTDPRWRRGSWSPLDTLLGREAYSETEIARGTVEIDMPEGAYPAEFKVYAAQWKRPRWPFAKRSTRFEFKMVDPIPEPGKGENFWDMDDTATFEASLHSTSLDEAVARIRASILRRRERYGGKSWRPAPVEAQS